MKLRYAIATGSLAALGLGGVGMAVAMAQPTPGGVTTVVLAPTPGHGSPDGDTTQQGDQTTPDVAGDNEAKNTSEAPESSVEAADNPAGHADPAGNVDHNGGPNEP